MLYINKRSNTGEESGEEDQKTYVLRVQSFFGKPDYEKL